MLILLIAVLHALPIFVVAWVSNSKAWVWFAAAMSAIIAVALGNLTYLFADLLAIGLALWNCLEVLKQRKRSEPAQEPVAPRELKSSTDVVSWIVPLLALSAFAFILLQPDRNPQTLAAPVAEPTPTPSNTSAEALAPSQAGQLTAPRTQGPSTRELRDRLIVERCLKIADEREMTQCLEKVK